VELMETSKQAHVPPRRAHCIASIIGSGINGNPSPNNSDEVEKIKGIASIIGSGINGNLD